MGLSKCLFLVGLVVVTSCGKSLEKQVRDQVRTLDGAELDKDAVQILSIRESGSQATAEVQINTAVKMKKEGNRWTLEEVRIGDRRWENVQNILEAIEQSRAAATRRQMALVRQGIDRYISQYGRAPQVSDYTALVDTLNPDFLASVIRIDAWSNPFSFELVGESGFELRSAGPDGTIGTEDDLVVKR